MSRVTIPDEVRRFILTSIPSVPYLEAMLIVRHAPAEFWDAKKLAQRLYLSEQTAAGLLAELQAAEVLVLADPEFLTYQYCPASSELRQSIDQLAEIYSRHLVEVTNIIHSSTGKKAQQFADAFKWRKDS